MPSESLSNQTSEPHFAFKHALQICGLVLGLKLIFVFALAFNTRFVMDEFWHFTQSNYLFNGFFETIWPAKAVFYTVFYKLSHWIGWDAQTMLLAGRLQTAFLTCLLLCMLYALCCELGRSKLQAIIVLIVLLCFSTFMERHFRLRSEPLAIFFAFAALLTVVRGSADATGRIVLAGLFCGLAFVTTQKSVYFNLALGLALVLDAFFQKRFLAGVRRGGLLILAVLTTILAYSVVFGGFDFLNVLQVLFLGPLEVASIGQDKYTYLSSFVFQTLQRNAPLYVMCFLGGILALLRFGKLDENNRLFLLFTVFITGLVFAHNQPWPYVFTMALPFMAPLALVPFDLTENKPMLRKAILTIFAVVALLSFKRNFDYLRHNNDEQLVLITQAEKLLESDGTYFDGIGMIPSRTMAPRLWLDNQGVTEALTQGEASRLMGSLYTNPPDAVLLSYRTDALSEQLTPYLKGRYIAVSSNIMLPGQRLKLNQPNDFEVMIPQEYALYNTSGSPISGRVNVDGTWQTLPVFLEKGRHALHAEISEETFLLPSGLILVGIQTSAAFAPLFKGIYNF